MDRGSGAAPNVVRSLIASFRSNQPLVKTLVSRIRSLALDVEKRFGRDFRYKIMDFCGTHEWTITHFGVRSLMPSSIELVAGPGCPVCVTPSHHIEEAIKLALDGVAVYTYGDVYRLRSVRVVRGASSLSDARALGGSVKVVTSILDAINDARSSGREAVFIGIGFETVAPGYAHVVDRELLPDNLKILSLVKLTPPAMLYSIDVLRENSSAEPPVMGVIAPGHVSTIVGGRAWASVAEKFRIPVVVSGFEPVDVLISIAEILRQLAMGEARIVIEYTRMVTWNGDQRAQNLISKVFEVVDDAWRGIGFIPQSGLRLRNQYSRYDAFREYSIRDLSPENWKYDLPPGCRCGEVIIGRIKPTQCPLFMRGCTPSTPVGPCMVSIEGTCSIWARLGVEGLAEEIARELELL